MVTSLPVIREHIDQPSGYNASISPFAKVDPADLEKNLSIVDGLLFGFFTLDLIFRFIICPEKLKFIKNFINIIDFLSILAFWIFFIVFKVHDLHNLHKIRRVCESTRILLFYKITYINWRGSTIGIAIKKSAMEILVAFFFIVLSLLMISTIIFFIEKSYTDTYSSIPAAFW